MKTVSPHRACPVCCGRSAELLHHQRFVLPQGYRLPNSYDVVSCAACGFVYADTTATQVEYDDYYEAHSIYQGSELATGSGVGEFDRKRLSDFSLMIADSFKDKAIRILDAGCASGGLLSELRTLGFSDLAGMDASESCVQEIVKRGIRGIRGSIHTRGGGRYRPLDETGFDLIIMTGVLEHIRELHEALEFLGANLKREGCAFIRVPDATSYSSHYVLPYYYFDIEHINHFAPNDLLNLFCPRGFALVTSGSLAFAVSQELSYPDIYAVFRKSVGASREIRYSDEGRRSIVDFVNRSAVDPYGNHSLQELCDTNEAVVVWGAGMNTYRMLASTLLGKCNVAAFIDAQPVKHGRLLMGKPIVPPEYLNAFNGAVVLSTAFHNRQIEEKLKRSGLSNRVVSL